MARALRWLPVRTLRTQHTNCAARFQPSLRTTARQRRKPHVNQADRTSNIMLTEALLPLSAAQRPAATVAASPPALPRPRLLRTRRAASLGDTAAQSSLTIMERRGKWARTSGQQDLQSAILHPAEKAFLCILECGTKAKATSRLTGLPDLPKTVAERSLHKVSRAVESTGRNQIVKERCGRLPVVPERSAGR